MKYYDLGQWIRNSVNSKMMVLVESMNAGMVNLYTEWVDIPVGEETTSLLQWKHSNVVNLPPGRKLIIPINNDT